MAYNRLDDWVSANTKENLTRDDEDNEVLGNAGS
jgi:hypothetical protein